MFGKFSSATSVPASADTSLASVNSLANASAEPSLSNETAITQLNEARREAAREAFSFFDSNDDGYLNFHGLLHAFTALGLDTTKADVLDALKQADPENARRIDWTQFSRMVDVRLAMQKPLDELRKAFGIIDVNGSGYIELDDLKQLAQRTNVSIKEDELEAMIDTFDLDEDKRISLDEFVRMALRE